jgi:nucleoside-diphosphate-sugar epimerase
MNVLLIGGTGLISTGIIKHLLARGANIAMFNRGRRENTLPGDVEQITGDRDAPGALHQLAQQRKLDVVIDMICFTPQQAQTSIDAFAGRCTHFIFCSTVCTYGTTVPPNVLIDETFPQAPISDYGRNKLACEELFLQAHEQKKLNVTLIRPSSTYGPGGRLVDNLESHPVAWDRIERGLPVLCAGDGLGLWISTHRDDCGKLFAYAALNPLTFGQSYNATRDRVFTWRDLYHEAGIALGKPVDLLFMPAQWIIRHDPQRFSLLREITQFHGAYTSAKAKRDIPEFRCEIDYPDGARQTLDDLRRRNTWRDSRDDSLYDAMVEQAMHLGIEPLRV